MTVSAVGLRPDPRELFQAARAGSREAREALVTLLHPWAVSALQKLRIPREDALGVFFEALQSAIDRTSSCGPNFKSWFFGVLRNHVGTIQRREAKHSARFTSLDDQEPPSRRIDQVNEQALSLRIAFEEIAGELGSPQRELITAYLETPRQYHRIAHSLGWPVGTVKSRLDRLSNQLQRDPRLVSHRQNMEPRRASEATDRHESNDSQQEEHVMTVDPLDEIRITLQSEATRLSARLAELDSEVADVRAELKRVEACAAALDPKPRTAKSAPSVSDQWLLDTVEQVLAAAPAGLTEEDVQAQVLTAVREAKISGRGLHTKVPRVLGDSRFKRNGERYVLESSAQPGVAAESGLRLAAESR